MQSDDLAWMAPPKPMLAGDSLIDAAADAVDEINQMNLAKSLMTDVAFTSAQTLLSPGPENVQWRNLDERKSSHWKPATREERAGFAAHSAEAFHACCESRAIERKIAQPDANRTL